MQFFSYEIVYAGYSRTQHHAATRNSDHAKFRQGKFRRNIKNDQLSTVLTFLCPDI